ncbi:hypothetical protein BD410DRAFT_766007 [Rickenella mellea]|uniref:Endoplasmic reticulum junction formation protein lunapark n=1 Tax=Rickenella mellea TaxID=50990 RepID=A0A4Y7QCR9_9AGAM|nr:hypothetical protein BD410DRAFT_766007 [Rickenella mellea]
MAFFSGLFSRKEPEDYEQVLAALALDIQKRQTRLSEIRLRERRTTLLVTLYTFVIWTVYVVLWYTGWLPNMSQRPNASAFEKMAKGTPLVLGPILIQFSRRIVQTWYSRIGNAEESTLKSLLAKQRTKIEEIKKKTNYYTTKNLLERYDDSPSNTPPNAARRRSMAPNQILQQQQQQPGTPQRQQRTAQANGGGAPHQTPANRFPGALSPSPATPLAPPRKQWYDKVADALLGEDEFSSGGSGSAAANANRYALICQKCFSHNGLVKESLWEDTQYVCPKCGHFNPSVRSQRAAAATANSPLSPALTSPTSSTSPQSPQSPSSPFPEMTSPSPMIPKGKSAAAMGRNANVSGGSGGRKSTSHSPLAQPVELDDDDEDRGIGEDGKEGRVGEKSVRMEVDS